MPWKREADGTLALVDGNPVRIDHTGHEVAVPDSALDETFSKVSQLVSESMSRKEKIRAMESKLKVFEGIDDLEAWKAEAEKSMSTLKNMEDKKLIDAGEVEKVKEEVAKAMQSKIDELQRNLKDKDAVIQEKENFLHQELIGGRFARSQFINDRLAIPVDMVQHRFGANFKVVDGKVVAFDSTGNELFSKNKPGELADFDEALEMIVSAYPHKDAILRGSSASGAGVQGGGGGYHPGSRVVNANDAKSFSANIDRIAKGEVQVIRQ